MSCWKETGKEAFQKAEAAVGSLRLVIHRHIDHEPSAWFLSVREISVESHPLKALNLDTAKREAVNYVQKRLQVLENNLAAILVRTP